MTGYVSGAVLSLLIALADGTGVPPGPQVDFPGAVVPQFSHNGVPVRMPGEFERQRTLLLSCRELTEWFTPTFAQIIKETHGKLDILLLVCDDLEYSAVLDVLTAHDIPQDWVRVVAVPHDTMWSRDYGPIIAARPDGTPVVIDADYGDTSREQDNHVPEGVASVLKVPLVACPLQLDGGNLLSNGRGLIICTTEMLTLNEQLGLDEAAIRKTLCDFFGANQVVFLEPLIGEPTGHADMFATFTSADTVVVGSYSPSFDVENSAILDRNAEVLSRVRTSSGPLRVVRVPMPPRTGGLWRTYTNVVYANGVMLVPVYPGIDSAGRLRTLRTYARLRPGWRIVGVDARSVVQFGGALHCITMNLGPARIPKEMPAFPNVDLLRSQRLLEQLEVANPEPFPDSLPAPRLLPPVTDPVLRLRPAR